MGLEVLDWTKRNSGRLSHIRRNRLDRGIDPMAPLTLDTYVAYSAATSQSLDFAARVGGRYADAFLRRLDEYCAKNCAQTGRVMVARSRFGALVLSSNLDPVGQSLGESVYDALIDSKICAALVGDVTGDVTKRKTRDVTRGVGDVTEGAARDVTESSGDVTKPPGDPSALGDVTDGASRVGAAHAQGTRSARAERAGDPQSSPQPLSGDVTGDVTGASPCQSQPGTSAKRRETDSPGLPFRAPPVLVVDDAESARIVDEVRSVAMEPDDPRQRAALMLMGDAPERRDGTWYRAARGVLGLPGKAKALFGRGASSEPAVASQGLRETA